MLQIVIYVSGKKLKYVTGIDTVNKFTQRTSMSARLRGSDAGNDGKRGRVREHDCWTSQIAVRGQRFCLSPKTRKKASKIKSE